MQYWINKLTSFQLLPVIFTVLINLCQITCILLSVGNFFLSNLFLSFREKYTLLVFRICCFRSKIYPQWVIVNRFTFGFVYVLGFNIRERVTGTQKKNFQCSGSFGPFRYRFIFNVLGHAILLAISALSTGCWLNWNITLTNYTCSRKTHKKKKHKEANKRHG